MFCRELSKIQTLKSITIETILYTARKKGNGYAEDDSDAAVNDNENEKEEDDFSSRSPKANLLESKF